MMPEDAFSREDWVWKELAPPAVRARKDGFSPLQLLIPLIIAGILVLWGKLLFGAVVAAIGLALVLLRFAAPRAHQILMKLLTALGLWLARAISYSFLAVVYVVIFAPIAVAARLLGRDSLDLKRRRSSSTYWSRVPNVNPIRLFARPFLSEVRADAENGSFTTVFRRVSALLHVALMLLFLNFAIAFVYEKANDFIREAGAIDARSKKSVYANSTWVEDFWRETHESRNYNYAPFIGWVRGDYAGQYVNIKDGQRRTYRAPAQKGRAYQLYAFGGSTMFGTGARDDYTIPSYLARRAEQAGMNLEVTSFGERAFVNWQNVLRLAELCAQGRVPDFVVFYEGANDVASKLKTPTLARSHHYHEDWRNLTKPENYQAHYAKQWFERYSLVHKVGRRIGHERAVRRARETNLSTEAARVQRLANEVVATYAENAAFVRKLADAYGFRVWFFWQPVVVTKARRTEEERYYGDRFGGLFDAVYTAATARMQLEDFATNLSRAFDDQEATIYIDFAHVSEEGNRIVTDRIFEHVRPHLRSLIDSREGGA
jgi:hypothetical protein